VIEIYSRYLWLYDDKDYLPREEIDLAYLENDIDY
jgi:hypothetical protein